MVFFVFQINVFFSIPPSPPLLLNYASSLKVNRLVIGVHARLLERLAKRGVRMAGSCDVLRTSSVLHSQHGLGDHLTGVRAEDVSSQDSVGVLVGEDLDKAFARTVSACPGVGGEWEISHDVVDCDARIGVNGLKLQG